MSNKIKAAVFALFVVLALTAIVTAALMNPFKTAVVLTILVIVFFAAAVFFIAYIETLSYIESRNQTK